MEAKEMARKKKKEEQQTQPIQPAETKQEG